MSGITKILFTIDGNAGSSASNRFLVVFRPAAIVAPVITSTSSIAVMPNPVEHGQMNMKFSNEAAGKYTVRLINMTGQSVYESEINFAGGTSGETLQLPALPQGVYKLQTINPTNQSSVQKVMVINGN